MLSACVGLASHTQERQQEHGVRRQPCSSSGISLQTFERPHRWSDGPPQWLVQAIRTANSAAENSSCSRTHDLEQWALATVQLHRDRSIKAEAIARMRSFPIQVATRPRFPHTDLHTYCNRPSALLQLSRVHPLPETVVGRSVLPSDLPLPGFPRRLVESHQRFILHSEESSLIDTVTFRERRVGTFGPARRVADPTSTLDPSKYR